MRRASILGVACALFLAGEAVAGERPEGIVTAVTVGAMVHDLGGGNDESETFDLELEARFRPIVLYEGDSKLLSILLNPEPTVGAAVNSDFDTNRLHAGVAWPIELGGGFYLLPFFGATLHDGNTDDGDRPSDPELGSHLLFREAIDLGYRFGERHALALSASHISNAGLADENEGMNFVGLRYSYLFP